MVGHRNLCTCLFSLEIERISKEYLKTNGGHHRSPTKLGFKLFQDQLKICSLVNEFREAFLMKHTRPPLFTHDQNEMHTLKA
jgi:hypothetical protein